ncbi:MAG: hypothetical protein AAFO70_01470, partial [Pseudomonadota bacterium]
MAAIIVKACGKSLFVAFAMTNAVHTHRLDAPATTILFGWTTGVPEVIYFGDALPADLDVETYARSRSRPLGHATLDAQAAISMQPEVSTGFMGHPGLIAHS